MGRPAWHGEPAAMISVMATKAETPTERTARILRTQATHCELLGSALYAGLLRHSADDLLADGPTAGVLEGHLEDPGRSALPLRMLGGVHALVLTGRARELATFYPSAGGTADPSPKEEFSFMYGRSFEDPDGHMWAVNWMDLAAAPAQPAMA